MVVLLHCNHCKDVIKLTEKPKQCECGACVGAKTGENYSGPIYSHSGNGICYKVHPTPGGKFVGSKMRSNILKLGKKEEITSKKSEPNEIFTFTETFSTILIKVKAIIGSISGLSLKGIHNDASLSTFGIDPLDYVEIIMTVEKDFNIHISDDIVDSLNTPRKLAEYVEKKIRK